MEKKFCLLNEPWIRVITNNAELQEVSLIDVFRNAHKYKDLAGEIPMQNFAVARLLIAIVYTVLTRYDIHGEKRHISNPDEMLDYFEEVWGTHFFPEQAFENYLTEWQECFWMIHPDTPFYQVKCGDKEKMGTSCSAAKMNGTLFESNNQIQLFSGRGGEKKNKLTLSEAARWLVFLNAFDDCAAKKPSPKECWVSKLGLTMAKGRTLFETLMLNCKLIKNDVECWPENVPSWEITREKNDILQQIAPPKGLAALYTIRSRLIKLDISSNDMVTGYQVAAGDFFEGKNYFTEPMTMWRHVKAKRSEPEYWSPQKYDSNRQVWREFPTIMSLDGNMGESGIVQWIKILQEEAILDKNYYVTVEVCSVHYGSMSCKIAQEVHDEITFSIEILSKIKRKWQKMIQEMVEITEDTAFAVKYLAKQIQIASGISPSIANGEKESEQFYYRIDPLFRIWLYNLKPDNDDAFEETRKKWRDQLFETAKSYAKELVQVSNDAAFVGRTVTTEEKNSKAARHYSVPEAYNVFFWKIKKILEEGGK